MTDNTHSSSVETITVTPEIVDLFDGQSPHDFMVKDDSQSDESDYNDETESEESVNENEEQSPQSKTVDKRKQRQFRSVFVKDFHGDDGTEPNKVYSCDACNLFFTLEIYYLRHIKFKHGVFVDLSLHNEEKPKEENKVLDKRCPTCSKCFTTTEALKVHVLRVHEGLQCFKCKVCNAYFQQYTSFMSHMKFHSNEQTYTCDLCDFKTNKKNTLYFHKVKHDTKQFVCRICSKVFSRADCLQTHLKIHSNVKTFYCDICQRAFIRASDLAIHRKIHSDEKPFKCSTCLTRFRHRSALIVHIRQHTGERPFRCHLCNKGYAQSGNLKMHLLKCKEPVVATN